MTTDRSDETQGQDTDEASQRKAAPSRRRRASGSDEGAAKGKAKSARKPRTTRAKAQPKAAEESAPARGRRRTSRAAAVEESPAPTELQRPAPRLLERLRNDVGPVLIREFGYTSTMQIPRLSKVVLNIGLGEALENSRAMENAQGDLQRISGQRPVITRARRSVAGFKIRQGMAIGLSVTLRGRRMYEFMDRLMNSSLPRIRDFQGVSRNSFDGRGNYALGIREQVIFPEVDYNSIDRIRGLQVVVCTTARTDPEGLRMLELLGMPFTRTREAARVA